MTYPQSRVDSQSAQMVELPPMGELNADELATRSKTHWFWTCYKDINNMGPIEMYSQLGYRDRRWTVLKRCTPYPLGNLNSSEIDRRAVAEAHESGFSVNFNAETSPKVEYTKYGLDQAVELGERYRDVGGRVLLPLTGIDDAELVGQIIAAVQPFAYALHEMDYEFSVGAEQRIRQSGLSEPERGIARETAKVMRNGAVAGVIKAKAEYEALITSMSDAQIGKPGISNPTEFHEWVCQQLGVDVPTRVNRMAPQQGGTDSATIKALLERDAAREQELAELRAMVKQQVQVQAESATKPQTVPLKVGK